MVDVGELRVEVESGKDEGKQSQAKVSTRDGP